MKLKLGEKAMANLVQLKGKTYCDLIYHNSEDKKAKSAQKSVIKKASLNLKISIGGSKQLNFRIKLSI